MRYGVLGTTLVWSADGQQVPVGGPRVRTLLTLLLLEAGQVVTADRLIDGLYGQAPPATAANALQAQVSRLRRALPGAVEFHPGGYRLIAELDHIDAHLFQRLVTEGRQALTGGDHHRAAKVLREALELWRGPALADAPNAPARAARLEELRLDATEDRVEAELALGENPALIGELRQLVSEHPLRERARAQLMRALYAAGRQADALTEYEDARRVLADELGADPSPALAETHLAVLRAESAPQPRRGRLPAQLTSFVGRTDELTLIGTQLTTSRLVTLLGPGGAGKTRLAVEAAGRAGGEVYFVDLAPLAEGSEVGPTVVAALGLRDTALLPSAGTAGDVVPRLTSALADRDVLLVLDNCEHLITPVARLAHQLLAGCPRLRVLATSREPLAITGESICPVAPMTSESAARLFADRAAAVRHDVVLDADTVARICAGLDGLPLAIELAAARLRTLSLTDIAARLDDRFRLLSRGDRTKAERHQTLRAVVEWSWDLLTPDEQTAASRLTVFAGGALLAAAEEVCGLPDTEDVLAGLVDKSLVDVVGGRYRMLDTIRTFCAEHLVDGDAVRAAHLRYFLNFARAAETHLRSREQVEWMARLGAEHGNVLAALRHAVPDDLDSALRLAGELAGYWYLRGVRAEITPLVTELLDRVGTEPPPELVEQYALCVFTVAAVRGVRGEFMSPHAESARVIVDSMTTPPRLPFVTVLWVLSVGASAEEPVGRSIDTIFDGSPWQQALAHFSTGYMGLFTGDVPTASAEFAVSLAGFRTAGCRWGMSNAIDATAMLASWRGEHEQALRLTDEALELIRQLDAVEDVADLLCRRADRIVHSGDLDAAQRGYEQAEDAARRIGMPETLAAAQRGLGDIARLRGRFADAHRHYDQALAGCVTDSVSATGIRTAVLIGRARLAGAEGDVEAARTLHRQVFQITDGFRTVVGVAEAVESAAELAVLDGDGTQAALLLGAAVALRGSAVAGDPDVNRTAARARDLIGDTAFDTAYQRGAALTRAQAAALVR